MPSHRRIVVCGSDGAGTHTVARCLAQATGARATFADVASSSASLRQLVAEARGADAAIVVVDVRSGLETAARVQLYVLNLLGVRRVALVANDLGPSGVSREVFEHVAADALAFALRIGVQGLQCVPISGLAGDNLLATSSKLAWYAGPTLLGWLDGQRGPPTDSGIPRSPGPPPEAADQYEASLIWFAQEPMLPGRRFLVRIDSEALGATVTHLKHTVDVDTLEHLAARTLGRDAIGVGVLSFDTPVVLDLAYARPAGADFVIVTRDADATLGAGRVHFALRRSHNLAWQATDVDHRARTASMGHRPCIVWFTGLSGAGKSTIANLLEKALHARGCHTYLLDGDNVRHGLNRDLGFTDADRVENIRRIAEVARLMADAGLVVLVSFISPFRAERRMARALARPGEFCEVFVDAPLAVAEARDAKGLYAKARRGELPHFTGIDSPYEAPEHPELRIDTVTVSAATAAERVVDHLRDAGVID